MSAPSDRRGFLRGLATLPLACGGATLAGQTMAAPVAVSAVQDVAERAIAASLRYERLELERCDIEEARHQALIPLRDALAVRPDDPWEFVRPHRSGFDGKQRYNAACLSSLRRMTVVPSGYEERRKEIIEALERFEAEKRRLDHTLGLLAAEAAEMEAACASRALNDELVATPATTLADMIVKARAIKRIYGDDEPGCDDDTLDTRLAMSIVRDLLALDSAA